MIHGRTAEVSAAPVAPKTHEGAAEVKATTPA
jgi:hypothetical protein